MNLKDFWNASDVCWPPIKKLEIGPWTIREGGVVVTEYPQRL